MHESVSAILAGLGICLGLIISIGAQNAVVLRYGIRKEHVGAIVIACIASEIVLQTAGVAGVGLIAEHLPWVEPVARWVGAIFLVVYAGMCAWRAWKGGESMKPAPEGAEADGGGVAVVKQTSRRAAVLTVLACTWLNPQAVIETTLVLGGIAATHGDARWWFLAGGLAAATMWFVAFGYGARLLAPLLSTPRAWRILDAVIAVVMLVIAATLILA